MSTMLMKSDLLDLSMIVASENAPVEKKGFYDQDDKWVVIYKRLGNAWTRKKCKEVCSSILRVVKSRMSESDRKVLNSMIESASLEKGYQYDAALRVLIAIAASEYDMDTLREYAPAIVALSK